MKKKKKEYSGGDFISLKIISTHIPIIVITAHAFYTAICKFLARVVEFTRGFAISSRRV